MSVMRYIIRGMLRATGKKADTGGRLSVVVTPAKYKFNSLIGQFCKVMPAQGYTRRQRRKDRRTHIFLSDIKREKLLAKKAEAAQEQRKNRVIQFLRGR